MRGEAESRIIAVYGLPKKLPALKADLHTHTTASDGVLTPAELVRRAAEQGVELLAITDHDTVAAYEGLEVPAGLTLLSGVELSCQWHGINIHVVGLGFTLAADAMREALARQSRARDERAEIIAARLHKLGFSGALEGARRHAGGAEIGRPHFAAFLVEAGHVPDVERAFNRYLGAGKPGDVKALWPELPEAVGWIRAAGGVAVLAHPLHYKMTNTKLRRLVDDFRAAGGQAIEMAAVGAPSSQNDMLISIARARDMALSTGSDFHRPAFGVELGLARPVPNGSTPVWSLLV